MYLEAGNFAARKIEVPTLPKLIDPIFLVDEHGACHVLGGEVGIYVPFQIYSGLQETGITGPFKKSHNISLDIAVGRIGGSYVHGECTYIANSTFHYGSRLIPFKIDFKENTRAKNSSTDRDEILNFGSSTLNGKDGNL